MYMYILYIYICMVPAMNITSPSRGYRQPIIEISTNQKQETAGPFPTWATPKSSP